VLFIVFFEKAPSRRSNTRSHIVLLQRPSHKRIETNKEKNKAGASSSSASSASAAAAACHLILSMRPLPHRFLGRNHETNRINRAAAFQLSDRIVAV